MKVLLAFFEIADPGGIVNHNENLTAGLLALGHTPHTALMVARSSLPRNGVAGGRGTVSPFTGLEYDQRRGYSWPNSACVPYRGSALKSAKSFIEDYDIVIWQIAVPTKRAENKGNDDWLALYETSERIKQIAVIHDGNFLNSYPWLYEISSCLDGLACVHHCALNSAKNIAIPSALILNPQEINPLPAFSLSEFKDRVPGFLSVQTWKGWKRVPELLEALPHAGGITKLLAGKGIDYYYLTSKDRCKYPGVWQGAVDAGMQYLDIITNEERDQHLRAVTCLVDNSWSKKYAAIGGHFNRVMVDAIKQGAVPIARPMGIGAELFLGGHNCLTIPDNLAPDELGDALKFHCNLGYETYCRIMGEARALLPLFERSHIARQCIQLAYGDLSATQTGVDSPEVRRNSEWAIKEFFSSKNAVGA